MIVIAIWCFSQVIVGDTFDTDTETVGDCPMNYTAWSMVFITPLHKPMQWEECADACYSDANCTNWEYDPKGIGFSR